MEPNQIAAFKLIEEAQQAMKRGEHTAARQFAAQAAQSAPELEEVWLIMAALASPRGSVAFLQKALGINPQSARAQKGLLWAQNRLQQELDRQAAEALTVAPVVEQPGPVIAAPEVENSVERENEPAETVSETREQVAEVSDPVAETLKSKKPAQWETEHAETVREARKQAADESEPVAVASEAEKPVAAVTAAVLEPKTSPRKPVAALKPVTVTKTTQSEKTVTSRRYSYLLLPLLAVFICCVVSFFVLQGVSPAAAFINSNVFNGREHGPAWAEVNVSKPTSSSAALETVILPTASPLPATVPELSLPPTASDAPLPTEAPLPTNTLVPTEIPPTQTETPLPTKTPVPTATPTATAELAFVEGPSPTPLPTDTAVPVPTRYTAPTAKPGGITAGLAGERWIDVDLTRQMVYAFEGNSVINSFLVSTGTWQYPTVTGQYRVYIKYRSTTMSGPGYSLPNVPYAMYFYKSYGIHGTYWHNNFGTPMSHGCVNLTIPDAEWLYNWSSIGTLVNVHY